MTIQNKQSIRYNIRKQRHQLSDTQKTQAAKAITQRLIQLSQYIENQQIAAYISHNGEINTNLIIQHALSNGKNVHLPALHTNKQNELLFYPYQANDQLVDNQFGIPEPNSTKLSAIAITDLDLILMPLVAFDKRGHRLGRGAGYYDKTLEPIKNKPIKQRPCLIGLGYDFQKLDHIQHEDWDVPMDIVITENSTFYCNKEIQKN